MYDMHMAPFHNFARNITSIAAPLFLWPIALPFIAGLLMMSSTWLLSEDHNVTAPICVSPFLPKLIIGICLCIVVAVNVKIWLRDKTDHPLAAVLFILTSLFIMPTTIDLIQAFVVYGEISPTDSTETIHLYCEK